MILSTLFVVIICCLLYVCVYVHVCFGRYRLARVLRLKILVCLIEWHFMVFLGWMG